jgi:hypothetical protein
MADNVGYTPGTGATVAADEIGGVLHQRIKLGIGDDGVAVDVSESNPMPVELVGVNESAPLSVSDDAIAQLLGMLLQYQDSPRGYDKSLQRQRATVLVESGTVTTVTTVTTVSTVTNLSTIDTLQGRIQVYGQNLAAWHSVVRSRIS